MTKDIKKKAPKGALERIVDIENVIPGLINAVNQSFTQFEQRIVGLTEIVDSLIESVGTEKVQAVIQERRDRQGRERAEEARLWVENEKAAGRLEALDTVVEDSLIVGVETDPEGVQLGAGRTQLTTDRIKPEILEKLLGQPVGVRIETEGGLFEVLEIYRRIEAPVPAELPSEPAQATAGG